MTDSYVQVNADGAGKKVDAEQVTVGANDVQRQRVEIAGAAAAAVAAVQATAVAGTEQGLVVRPVEQVIATDLATDPAYTFKCVGGFSGNAGGPAAIQIGANSGVLVEAPVALKVGIFDTTSANQAQVESAGPTPPSGYCLNVRAILYAIYDDGDTQTLKPVQCDSTGALYHVAPPA